MAEEAKTERTAEDHVAMGHGPDGTATTGANVVWRG